MKLIVLTLGLFCAFLTFAQIPLPPDLAPIAPQDVTRSATWFSMAHTTWPPTPCNPLQGTSAADTPLYYSPTLGPGYVWLADFAVDYDTIWLANLLADGQTPDDPDGPGPLGNTNELWLSLSEKDRDFANKTAVVWAHNTTNNVLYSLLKATNVAGPWVSAGLFVGTNTTPGVTPVRATSAMAPTGSSSVLAPANSPKAISSPAAPATSWSPSTAPTMCGPSLTA
jgi:hypothetical protein